MTQTHTAHRQHEEATSNRTGRLRSFIEARLVSGQTPRQVANAVHAYFDITIDSAHVIPFYRGEITLPTQTEHRPDKESVQFPADEENGSLFTRMADGETPDAAPAPFCTAPDSAPIRDGAPDADAPATQTGRRQDKTKSVLTDEIKAFIVRGLARYETPTRVAASVQAQFGIAIDRRQVFAYDPAGSRPPAQRWIDLHVATRAKFTRAASEIGIAQKVVRLRMLDRFANGAEEANYTDRAAKYLEQAAKECGGFYERYARPKAQRR
jgi:hypothetical protein